MLQFIIKDVPGTPAILVGLFSLIGLLLQKKPVQPDTFEARASAP